MDELETLEAEQRAIRFDLFKQHFDYAFNKLEPHFKVNTTVKFYFDEDWNLFAQLDDENLFYAPAVKSWIKVSSGS